MAVPRVFVSSTYYDLKHVRSSMELFIESLGYDAVLSEKGSIAYTPEQPLDESCYREVQNCDIFVLIIGGRYGSEASQGKSGSKKEFFDRYESITKMEYSAAVEKDLPIYILIERAVYAEYQTFLKNRENKTIQFAHVDSVNVFNLIDGILGQARNNPIEPFDKYEEIETWLRLQWAGFFRELLNRRSNQEQLVTLASQVQGLTEVNETLRRYLETVVSKVSPTDSAKIIKSEQNRLAKAQITNALHSNRLIRYLTEGGNLSFAVTRRAIEKANSVSDFVKTLEAADKQNSESRAIHVVERHAAALADFNQARRILGKPEFKVKLESAQEVGSTRTGQKFTKRSLRLKRPDTKG